MKYIITESQYSLLTESLSLNVRRRLPFKNLMNDMEWGVLDDIEVCNYDNIGEFIGDACDSLVNLYDDYFSQELNYDLQSKDKDSLYYYFVDYFGDFLVKYYKNMCA
jgi:hypothetical protein